MIQATALCIGLIIFTFDVRGQTRDETPPAAPENILVDRFTFMLPDGWKWQPNTDASSAEARLIIRGSASERSTDVRFYISDKSPDETKRVWDTFFNAGASLVEHSDRIGRYTVTYVSLTGTQKMNGRSVPGRKFVGAMIPVEGRYVLVRMFGPDMDVDRSTSAFNRMIREALLEEWPQYQTR